MSEASTAVLCDASLSGLPLSTLLFYTAMQQEIAIGDFAEQLGIGALSLRQFIAGQTRRPRGRTLELIAQALGISVEEARERTTFRPTAAPRFADWLKEQMEIKGRFSRARLTRETGISDGALRNYLSGQTLPDADQAQRLCYTLNVNPLELAKILVADQTVRAGGQTVSSTTDGVQPDAEDVAAQAVSSMDAAMDEEPIAPQSFNRNNRFMPASFASEEEHLLHLWHQLHPQGRRATLIYIAGLLAEG